MAADVTQVTGSRTGAAKDCFKPLYAGACFEPATYEDAQ